MDSFLAEVYVYMRCHKSRHFRTHFVKCELSFIYTHSKDSMGKTITSCKNSSYKHAVDIDKNNLVEPKQSIFLDNKIFIHCMQ